MLTYHSPSRRLGEKEVSGVFYHAMGHHSIEQTAQEEEGRHAKDDSAMS